MRRERNGTLRILRAVVVTGVVLFLLVNPSARAGHLTTSPATLALPGLPRPDATVIRGTTLRDSTGATDVPMGLVGRATGNATGFEGAVFGVLGETTGNAIGQDSWTQGVRGRATGNAAGPGSALLGVQGRVIGNATGSVSSLVGVQGRVTGDYTGQSAFIVGVHGRVDGNPTGPGATVTGVFGVTRGTSGTAYGVRGVSDSTGGTGVHGVATTPTGATNGVFGSSASMNGFGVRGAATAPTGETAGVYGASSSTSGRGVVGFGLATSGNTVGVQGVSHSPNGTAIHGIGNNGARAAVLQGRVEITCPVAPCVFVNGTGVADLAESMRVAGRVTPGDVVVLTGTQDYGLARAARSYDTRVAGIISAQPRIVLGVRHDSPSAPVAMVGVVRAKATASNGSIGLGDLLTTSRVPGHLMRCPAARRCVGAIVGKALEPLANGEKQILVLLWRQ